MLDLIALDIDPNVVKPGWTPFIITLVLAAVMVVLYRSMRHQFGRIRDLPSEAEAAGRAPGTVRTDAVRGPELRRRADGAPAGDVDNDGRRPDPRA